MKGILLMCMMAFSSLTLKAEIVTKEIAYKQDTTTCKGLLVYDAKLKGKRPGVLMVHEWWGLNDFTRGEAAKLAQSGYTVFAADMYGNGRIAPDMATAAKMAGEVRGTPLLRTRVVAALETLMKQPEADPQRIAGVGFCFGGTSVLELAYSGASIKGIVTFHGGIIVPQDADISGIKAKVLVLHGADDPNIPVETIVKFQEAMRKGHVDWQMVYYGNTVHSFTNPAAGNDNSKGAAYNPLSAERSWKLMQSFLKEIFGETDVKTAGKP